MLSNTDDNIPIIDEPLTLLRPKIVNLSYICNKILCNKSMFMIVIFTFSLHFQNLSLLEFTLIENIFKKCSFVSKIKIPQEINLIDGAI